MDCPDSDYQDMVILADLEELGEGTHTILAGCTDLHKAFPPSYEPMSSSPWTSSSRSSWAYWVKRVATAAWTDGYSFEEAQAAVWYITDRAGYYDGLGLLHSVGYEAGGPAKNVTSSDNRDNYFDDDRNSAGGNSSSSGVCGAVGFLPAPLLLGLETLRVVRRRRGPR